MTNHQAKDIGTFAAPRYYLAQADRNYAAVEALFSRLEWGKAKPRADFIENRFNAFCAILGALQDDRDWVFHTLLNKSHYDVSKWPIPYPAIRDTVKALKALGWIMPHGPRRLHRNSRFLAPPSSPLRTIKKIKLSKLPWEPPVVSIRRGVTDLERAPLDVEVMVNPKWKAWIAKYLAAPMEELNDKLLDHAFVLFPFGKADNWVQPQYQRIYTKTAGFKQEPSLLHGRIYPKNFYFPSKSKGWRQMTLIDGEPTVEVDVHASSLTLLSHDYYHGFQLPDTDDYYQFGALSRINRTVVKKIVQSLLNGVSPTRKTWPKSFREDAELMALTGESSWEECINPIVETYPVLASVRKNMGMFMMLTESAIIISAMNSLLDQGIGCLSIHDCLIVPASKVEQAKKAFNDAYAYHDYSAPKLKVS